MENETEVIDCLKKIRTLITKTLKLASGEKKIKPKKEFSPPSVEYVDSYCRSKGYNIDAARFVEYYEAAQWKDRRGNPVRNWYLLAYLWHKNNERRGVRTTIKSENNLEEALN